MAQICTRVSVSYRVHKNRGSGSVAKLGRFAATSRVMDAEVKVRHDTPLRPNYAKPLSETGSIWLACHKLACYKDEGLSPYTGTAHFSLFLSLFPQCSIHAKPVFPNPDVCARGIARQQLLNEKTWH